MLKEIGLAAALVLMSPMGSSAEEAMRPEGSAETLARFSIKEARQAVAVDANAFYAIDNATIAKYDKKSGQPMAQWDGGKNGPIVHLDSGVVVDGKLYAAHSNYPDWPMASSVEVWDAQTLKHVATHSFGIERGSLTWIDRDAKGQWWGAFANYNRVFGKSPIAYGNKYATQIVRFDESWRVAEAWTLPDELVEKFGDMSNSGGSWGPDGKLYITGHDNAELYVLEPPQMGIKMNWVGTVPLEIAGQGVAWDRSDQGVLYGIIRDKKDNKVTVSRIKPPEPKAL
jgi:hypothetical protein